MGVLRDQDLSILPEFRVPLAVGPTDPQEMFRVSLDHFWVFVVLRLPTDQFVEVFGSSLGDTPEFVVRPEEGPVREIDDERNFQPKGFADGPHHAESVWAVQASREHGRYNDRVRSGREWISNVDPSPIQFFASRLEKTHRLAKGLEDSHPRNPFRGIRIGWVHSCG
jgi:hypothetical protein